LERAIYSNTALMPCLGDTQRERERERERARERERERERGLWIFKKVWVEGTWIV